MGKNVLSKFSNEEIQSLLDSCHSQVEVLRTLKIPEYSGNHRELKKRIVSGGLSLDLLVKRRKDHLSSLGKRKGRTLEEVRGILSENSSLGPTEVRRYVIRFKLLPYVCSKCGNPGEWKGDPLSLQLDHRDGVRVNNNLGNLRFLCPNCHSQTDTFCGKNTFLSKRINKTCKDCGRPIGEKSTRCRKCSPRVQTQNRRFSIPRWELKSLIDKNPMVKVGKILGVSDNAVRKRCKFLGIEIPEHRKRSSNGRRPKS